MRDIQFVEEGRAFNVRCSIGVAMINEHSVKPEEILAQADMACHEAKGQGRNRFQIFTADAGDREQAAADMGWSDRIREALSNDGFSLRYQPIVEVGGGPTIMYEVLLRMRGHGKKIIPPGGFLPAADRFGLTGDLDYWVIRHAFEKLARVRQTQPEIVFTLNLSGIVFSDSRLVEYVDEQLDRWGIPGTSIVFEITEQVAIRYIEDATTIMRRLIDMGCRFALDDFGSGFSSFNYLKQLPVSYIKIDGAFIENLATDEADRAIVTSIAQIAKTVGTETIAEHVRNEETLAILDEIGIDYAQGFFLGRPRVELHDRAEVLSGAVDL
jgi:EAL domain-containing protein (putative c-di-GMP-specific phosphodiesterase class I)